MSYEMVVPSASRIPVAWRIQVRVPEKWTVYQTCTSEDEAISILARCRAWYPKDEFRVLRVAEEVLDL